MSNPNVRIEPHPVPLHLQTRLFSSSSLSSHLQATQPGTAEGEAKDSVFPPTLNGRRSCE